MKPHEINREIAEICGEAPMFVVKKGDYYYRQNSQGYTQCLHDAGRYTEAQAKAELCRGEPMRIVPLPGRGYYNDLNAMHEVWVGRVKGSRWHGVYKTHLQLIIMRDAEKLGWKSMCHATASQRAEAFLRTVGKWREETP